MGFTTPCFIRKNTKKIRKELYELGYNRPNGIIENERFCIATSSVNYNYHIIKEIINNVLLYITLLHSSA